jgi:hypothetical protein
MLREAFFKVRRANEEIERLNVEISRVYTWAQRELDIYAAKSVEVKEHDPALGHAIEGCRQQMDLMQVEIFRWLERCTRLPGYQGGQFSRPTAVAIHDEYDMPESDSGELTSLIDGAETSLLRLELLG